jgi:hypothetical protein
MNSFDYISPLYNNLPKSEELLKNFDSVLSSENLEILCIPFTTSISQNQWLEKFHKRYTRIKLLKESVDIKLFSLKINLAKNHDNTISGKFFVLNLKEFGNVYLCITLERSKIFQKKLTLFFESLYPEISFTYISNNNFRSIIEKFKEKNKIEKLLITRASQRLRFESDNIEKSMPVVSWPHMNIHEAFEWINLNNGWFQSIQFEYKRESSFHKITFMRNGIIKTNKFFSSIFDGFVLPICNCFYNNNKIFAHRGRKENINLLSKPLVIEFGDEQFRDTSENIKFIESLKLIKNSSISVLHGNPYVNMSIIDYYDGSTIDVWILNQYQIVLVPQMKATPPAINRLISHIFDTYAEGEVKEFNLEN